MLGATFPDRFAAIGPSAGWISWRTYGGRMGGMADTNSAMAAMLRRAAASSDTFGLVSNCLHQAVYILHGDADDNVPVSEARAMRERLGQFHHDFEWHEQPGAGHWWDASDEAGTDCVDWAPMFDLFARRRIPRMDEARCVRFTTVNPGVSSRCQWLEVEVQEHALQPSHVVARCDFGKRRIVAATTNVARLSFQVAAILPGAAPVTVELDGQKLEGVAVGPSVGRKNVGEAVLAFEKKGERWGVAGAADPAQKNPRRYGPFREAFNRRVLFVYATGGTAAENAWALGKARFDAESFGYRGNGSVDVISDTEYLDHPERAVLGTGAETGKRSVILYGNGDAHRAWSALLGGSPVEVRRGSVRVGGRRLEGETLGVLFLRPHPKDPEAMVGVVSGTGMAGLRLTDRLPVFLAGPGFPDCLVVGTDMLERGVEGVRAAGFFGADWGVADAEMVWSGDWR